jgi:hypothetical protein
MERRRREFRDLVVTAVALAVTLAILFTTRPLTRPSRTDRLAFELGYYDGVCSQATLASDVLTLAAEMRRLSAALGITAGWPAEPGCPDEEWRKKARGALSSQHAGSLSMGYLAAHLERSRLPEHGDRERPDVEGALYKWAERSYPGGSAAVKPFLRGEIDATELHRRLFQPQEALRYQLDIHAGPHAFALGYYLTACRHADAQAAPAMAAEIVRLAGALRLPGELLRASASADEARCPASTISDEHFGPWIGGLFFLGGTVALHEDLRRENQHQALDRLNRSMTEVARALDPLQVWPSTALFSEGRITAGELYQRLFGDAEPLLSGLPPARKEEGP